MSSYTYDDLYRLTTETITDPVNGDHNASYDYDAVGNRTSSTINGVTTSYNYDDNDRLTSAGGDSYSYDAYGNTTSKTESGVTSTLVYDDRNRLVSSTTGGVTTSYNYDVDGLRTERSSGGSSTSFITDNNRDFTQVVAEVTDGVFAKGYSFGDDLVSQVFPGGNVFYYHYDGLGSTRSLSDNTGTFTDEYDYEAFGELTGFTGTTDNDYLFTGEQFDSTLDNYYLRARYYDQGIGRFTQMDSFQGVNNQPVTLHKYLYTNIDPVNVIDPSGHIGISGILHAVAVTGSLATAAEVGFQAGSIIQRVATTGDVISAANVKSAAAIALAVIPMKFLVDAADLAGVAAKLERAGFASKIWDSSPNVTGFNKVFHWVQQLDKRGFTAEDALRALNEGDTWIDTTSGAIVKVLGNARENGTIKVLLVDGKITTVLSDKLTQKFVPFSPL